MIFLLKKLIKISLLCAVFACLIVLSVYFSLKDQLPDVNSLKNIEWQAPMQIFSADNKLISQFGEKKRIPLSLEEVPQQLIDALLATEDDRFYFHFGVDPIGMGRAVLGKLMGQNKGGGGTITMQVARNFFLTREVTIIRKVREIFLSFHIESLLTKDEILELYINKIELGHRAFGFGAAAQVYYGKTLNELSLAQIAVLAGLPKAPSTMNPISSPRRAKARRAVVLKRMLVSGYINDEEYQEARNAPITAKYHGAKITLSAPYIAEMAHQEVLSMFGKERAYTGGYKVFLTVPSNLQVAAQQAVIENTLNYDKRHGYRGAEANLISLLKPKESDASQEQPSDAPVFTEEDLQLLTPENIEQHLSEMERFKPLLPAVVTNVFEQSISVSLSDSETVTINWDGLSWAVPFINDAKQGPAPSSASEIVNIGDIIYIEPTGDTYQLSQLPEVSSALVSISPDDGAIKAAVGGFSFKQSQFNRVTQAKRQAGSNIKPFIYSAAIDNGFTLASIVNDAPINHWDESSGSVWRPKNSPPIYNGPIRVRLALAQSKNVIAVRLLRKVGLDNIIDHLTKFGFKVEDLPRGESLALGSASFTPLEVATGFATFANGGFLIQPYIISHIENAEGEIVYQANPAIACTKCDQLAAAETDDLTNEQEATGDSFLLFPDLSPDVLQKAPETQNLPVNKAPRVISAQNAFLMTEALNSAIWGADWSLKPFWQGTGFRARTLKRHDIAGKTGTTNQAKDAWFSGFSRRLVTTSWIGFDDHQRNLGRTRAGSEAGARSAQPGWILYMKEALKELPEEPFEQPSGITSVRIDKKTGLLTNKTDKTSLFEYFVIGTAPTQAIEEEHAEVHDNGSITAPVGDIF